MKVVSRIISQIDLFIEVKVKLSYEKIVNLLAKTILSTLCCEIKLNVKPIDVYFIWSYVIFF